MPTEPACSRRSASRSPAPCGCTWAPAAAGRRAPGEAHRAHEDPRRRRRPARGRLDGGPAAARGRGLFRSRKPAAAGGRDRPFRGTPLLRTDRPQPRRHRHRDLILRRRARFRDAHSRRRRSRAAPRARLDSGGRRGCRVRARSRTAPRRALAPDRAPRAARLCFQSRARDRGQAVAAPGESPHPGYRLLSSRCGDPARPPVVARAEPRLRPRRARRPHGARASPEDAGRAHCDRQQHSGFLVAKRAGRRAHRAHTPRPPGSRARTAGRRRLAAARGVLAGAHAHPVRGVLRIDPLLRPETRRGGATEPRPARARRCQHPVRAAPGHAGRGGSATSANAAAGARSPLAGLYSGAVVLTLVLLFLRWVERIPEPALAAIVIHAVSKALRPGVFADYFRWQRDRMLVVAAVLTVMIFGVLNGLLAGIAFSLALLLKSLASPRLSTLGALEEFCSWLAARGVQFRVARLKELAREALLRAQLAHLPASALDYSSVDDAVRGEGVSPTQQA